MIGKDETSPEEMREAESTQLKVGGGRSVIEQITVQGIKEYLAERGVTAQESTPEGMEFVGWMLDGWVSQTTLMDDNARPVYAFPHD